MFFALSGGGFKRRRGWKVGKRDLTNKDEDYEMNRSAVALGHIKLALSGRRKRSPHFTGLFGKPRGTGGGGGR